MLNIIYGTENSGRKEHFDTLIKESLLSSAASYILVPEQASLSTEKEVIKKYGIEAQTKIKVITFSRLCTLVFSNIGPLRLKYIDGAGKQIVAAKTIRALKGKLGILERALSRRGFSGDIVSLVSEFKRYGITPDVLNPSSLEIDDGDFSAKLKDISLIYETFDGFLNVSLSDAEDNLSLVCPKIKDCDFLKGNLFIRQFRSFTPVEHAAIKELMSLLHVYVEVCCDDISNPTSIFSSAAETCHILLDSAKEKGVPAAKPLCFPNSEPNGELDYLSKNYFASRPKVYAGIPENIQIYEALNAYRETEMAADLILRLCRTENCRFSDFLILARNTESYNSIAPTIFASRGIDIFLDKKRSLLDNPLSTLIISSLDILANGFSYERVLSLARTGLTEATDSEIDRLENYILAVNPTYAMWGAEKWEYCPEEYDIDDINLTRNKVLHFYNTLQTSLSGRHTAKDFCMALLSALESCSVKETVSALCDDFTSKEMLYLAREYNMVWNGLLSVISQISALMDDEHISRRDFLDLFRTTVSSISINLSPQTQGSVVLSSIDKFRGSAPIVIVLGLNDGVFPMPHTTEGIISDFERNLLSEKGIKLAPGADFKQKEEETLIYSVLTSAKEQLYLFYPLMTTMGELLSPSVLVKNIRTKLFPDIKVNNPDKGRDILYGSEGLVPAFEILCTYLSDIDGNIDALDPKIKPLYDYFMKKDEFKAELSTLVETMKNPKPEKLSKEAVEALYGSPIRLSASKLEKYNACAYAYFLSYGLLAAERDIAGIESRNTGNVQHSALYRYFSEIKESGFDYGEITKEACYKKIYTLVSEEAKKESELMYESSSYYKYLITKMQGITARTAWEIVKFYRSSKFRPYGFEIKIGTNGMIPLVEVKENGTTIATIRGFIDRADIAEVAGKSYVMVTDYKSSSKALDKRLAEAGINLQPLLYSDILAKRAKASPAAMFYMQMTDPIVDASKIKGELTYKEIEKAANKDVAFNGWISNNSTILALYGGGGENGESYKLTEVDEGELNRRIEQANEKIRESALGIFGGTVSAQPYCDKNFDACGYCIFKDVCPHR